MTAGHGSFAATYNVLGQTSAFGGTAAEYAGEGQAERTGLGSTDFGFTRLGLSSEETGGSFTHYRRDDKGGLVGEKLPNGSRYYYHRDALGSVLSVSDSSGTEANRYIYGDAYGEDLTTTGSTANPWKFAGEYQDTSDRYKIGERYYIPSLGRWTQRDPIMQPMSAAQSNGYSYVGGDPVNRTDPAGTWFAEKYIEEAYHTAEDFIFSDRLQTRSIWGRRAINVIRGSSAVTAIRGVYNCGRSVLGTDTVANCDPIGNYLGIEDAR
jgi:RHS repeat-associated protein